MPNFTHDSTRQSAYLLLLSSHNGGSLLEVQNYLAKKAKSERLSPPPEGLVGGFFVFNRDGRTP